MKPRVTQRAWLWQRLDDPGLEHFIIEETPERIVFDGALVALLDGEPLRLSYSVQCDARFAVQRVELTCVAREARHMVLNRDAQGCWTHGDGAGQSTLTGCDVVDIAATPSTNALALRSLGLSEGESADLRVVYIAVPSLEVSVDRQRYTLLRRRNDEAVYRFESSDAAPGFVAEVTVDVEGFVLDYEGLFRRL